MRRFALMCDLAFDRDSIVDQSVGYECMRRMVIATVEEGSNEIDVARSTGFSSTDAAKNFATGLAGIAELANATVRNLDPSVSC